MKRLVILMLTATLFFQCETDKSVGPAGNENEDMMTGNIKTAPYFYSFAKNDFVETFDLKFFNSGRTIAVYTNGGINGSAGVTGKNLGAVEFDAAADLNDLISETSENSVIGEGWYNYNPTTHTLSSKGDVYLLRAIDYKNYKLKIDSFESGGLFSITFSEVNEEGVPVNTQTLTVTATDESPACFQFATGAVLETIEPWDIAFMTIPLYIEQMNAYIQNPGLRVNSIDGAEVAVVSGTEFTKVNSSTTSQGFINDSGDSLAVGDGILNYDSQTHILTPPEVSYLVKTTDGDFAKFKVTSYYHPESGESGYISFLAESL